MAISKLSAEFYKPSYVEYIYCLRCPITFDIFYVGKTQKLASRFSQHLTEANHIRENVANKDKVDKIRGIILEGLIPILSVIDSTEIRTRIDKFHSAYKEIYWMQFYIKIGWNLTNKAGVSYPLEWSEYSNYLRMVKRGEQPPIKWYYFGKNSDGEEVYDTKRLNKDGWGFVQPSINIPERVNNYRALNNWRFLSKMGVSDTVTNTGQDKIPISTVVFPEQPSWTIEFARSIPYYEIIEDFDEDEDCDLELDMSDYEPNVDDEPDDYGEDDECANIWEKYWDMSVYINSLAIKNTG